jgi:hypothetical protein
MPLALENSMIGFTILGIFIAVGAAAILLEVAARRWLPDDASTTTPSLWQQLRPYVMFTTLQSPDGSFTWVDQYRNNAPIACTMLSNSEGFAAGVDFRIATPVPKAPEERVVIFTGGSAAWGVGATSYAASVAGRLETLLNGARTGMRYRVVNLAMGAWIAYQQYIGLTLYGRNFDPDWIVTMDGVNDAAVAFAHSQGAGYPMYYALLDAYARAFVFVQQEPVTFRSRFENSLIRRSRLYRELSGKKPVIFDVLIDTIDPGIGRSIIREAFWEDLELQLPFYVGAEELTIDLFPRAKILLSTQALPFDFAEFFGRIYETAGTQGHSEEVARIEARLEGLAMEHRGRRAGNERWPWARIWFMAKSAMALEQLANKARESARDVRYMNTGVVFPRTHDDRKAFFIDPVHLNDAGMDAVARLYAAEILASDFPARFQHPVWTGIDLPVATVRGENEKVISVSD